MYVDYLFQTDKKAAILEGYSLLRLLQTARRMRSLMRYLVRRGRV